jgi:hypothetical protein
MKELLFVYNLCGLANDNTDKWIEIIDKWLEYREDFDIAVSACNVNDKCKTKFAEHFKGKDIQINYIEDKLPVNITFNLNCKLNPGYKYYLYCSSDVEPNRQKNIIKKMVDFHKSNNNAITGAYVLHDSYHSNYNYIRDRVRKGENVTYKPGEGFNCHFALFDGSMLNHYPSLMPDVFESFATESVFIYVCLGINKNMGTVSAKAINLFHPHKDMDGSSSFTKNRGFQFLFRGDYRERLVTEEGRFVGFGYEEVGNVMPHRKEAYEDGKCKNAVALCNFVKRAVYLNDKEFDYMAINYDTKYF